MQKALTAKSVENGQNWVENASKYRRIKRQTQPEAALSAGIARSMSRQIAMKAFAAGDKLCPFTSEPWRRTYTSLPYLNGRTLVPGPVRRRTCWIERANQVNEQARRGCCGGL
jgi:hypothetical protein